jgi:hypothetical protein
MTRTERLQEWVETLNEEQLKKIVLELVDEAISSEYVNFYEESKVPYYDATGETLDGTEQVWDDEV